MLAGGLGRVLLAWAAGRGTAQLSRKVARRRTLRTRESTRCGDSENGPSRQAGDLPLEPEGPGKGERGNRRIYRLL